MSMTSRNRNLLTQDCGSVAVEAGLAIPVFLLMIGGIIEFALAFWQWNTMLLAVEQAGRYVMINKAACDANCAQAQMQNVLTAAAVCAAPAPGQMCVIATANAGNPQTMTLTARYNVNLIASIAPFTVTSSTTVPLI
jgi:Flp pilus assembly protein TadG